MRAYWYKNDEDCDQRFPHDSGNDVSPEYLAELGVIYYRLFSEKEVDELAQQRQYRNRDVINVSPQGLGAVYEQKIQSFFEEHIHEDEEIRYVLDGAGYFDVRGKTDDWVRIRLEKNDLIILPAGIYHRFSTDENNYIKAMRLFKEDPKWTPLNRDPVTDANPFRQTYLKTRTMQVE